MRDRSPVRDRSMTIMERALNRPLIQTHVKVPFRVVPLSKSEYPGHDAERMVWRDPRFQLTMNFVSVFEMSAAVIHDIRGRVGTSDLWSSTLSKSCQ